MANKTNEENMIYTQIAGLDIGNGCVKGAIESNLVSGDTIIDIQSVSAKNYDTTTTDLIKVSEADAGTYVADIFNYLDATFDTPCLDAPGRYFIGDHALRTRNTKTMVFETGENTIKSEQALAFILTLSCIAGKALQDAYNAESKLPESLSVNVDVVALALPIEEFRQYKDIYAEKYKNVKHKLTIHNFTKDIPVDITIANIQVFAEGAAAQLAIRKGGVEMAKQLLADAKANSDQLLEGITPELLAGVRGMMGVDIGEGTTNFPIYDGQGKFNADASMSIPDGYGVVLDRVRTKLKQRSSGAINFENRQALQDFLNNPESKLFKRTQYSIVQQEVDKAIDEFADKITDAYKDAIGKFNAQIMAVFVYGGGAYAMKPDLFKRLVSKTRSINGGNEAQPIMYFNLPEARILNRDGLLIAAKRVNELLSK